MKIPTYLEQFKSTMPLLDRADVIDIKTVESRATMRPFIARLIAYQPGWVSLLYRVRQGFVRLLGMQQPGIPRMPRYQPQDVPFEAGQSVAFFQVAQAVEDQCWFVMVRDQHLDAVLGVVAEPLPDGRFRYYVITLVAYNHWTGWVYFNVIRPFHHLVVRGMMQSGATAQPASA